MLTIRLQRTGKKKQADFRIVLAEKTAHVSKRFIEILGSYNPHKKAFNLKNPERLNYWLAQRVELSPTVNNLLVDKGLIKTGKVKAFNIPKKETASEAAAEKPETAAETVTVAEPPVEPATEVVEEQVEKGAE